MLSAAPEAPLSPQSSYRHVFASALFSSILRPSDKAKRIAGGIIPARLFLDANANNTSGGSGKSTPIPPALVPDDDEDPPQSLLCTLVGSVTLALRSRGQAVEEGSVAGVMEWDRVLIAYLSLLSVWCWGWEEGVKDVLEEGGALSVVCRLFSHALEFDEE